MSRDDIPTNHPCLACDGKYEIKEEQSDGRYKVSLCRWCTQGGMDRGQAVAWLTYKRKRKESRGHE